MFRSVGIIGYGSFGSLLHELIHRFAPSIHVKVFSPEREIDGEVFVAREEAARCDAVVFAVPIPAYEEALKETVPLMKENGIIVDVATIKMHTVALLKKHGAARPYIATHSMFGPESYAKRNRDVSGFRIVVAEHTLPRADYEHLIAFLRELKFNVIEMSANDHDKHLAQTLFLTHFIGQIINKAGFDRTEIDSVSFGFLMDAVESVKNDTKLFRDVFMYNPHCKRTIESFEKSEEAVLSELTQD